ncbi:hypothetical protein BDV12DRAFT_180641 [Aspergillus spectabilis]
MGPFTSKFRQLIGNSGVFGCCFWHATPFALSVENSLILNRPSAISHLKQFDPLLQSGPQ